MSSLNDPLIVLDRNRVQTHSLHNLLAGRSVFLLGGGPSVNALPLDNMNRRGVWTMAVNNAAGHPLIRPQAFVCSDPPKKFSHSIWNDPAIVKFVPSPKMHGRRARLRRKQGGVFVDYSATVPQMPNVWAFQRHSWLYPDDRFFNSDGACWGNHKEGAETTKEPKVVCTLLLGLRLLHYMGAKSVFLLGVDFWMGNGYGYSFDQNRDEDAVNSNNSHFVVVNKWLTTMQNEGVFQRAGMSVYNCFETSGLRAFPYVDFATALEVVCEGVEKTPDLTGWYDPEQSK